MLHQPEKHDLVYFVGDSRTLGMRQALGSSVPSNVKFVYKSGQGLTWFRQSGYGTLLRNIAKQPKRMKKAVVINLGTNDLRYYSQYVTYMRRVAQKLKAYNCDMYYLSVNPVNSMMIKRYIGWVSRTENQVETFNKAIRSGLCLERINISPILIHVRSFRNMDGSATGIIRDSTMEFIIPMKPISGSTITLSGR